MKKINKKFKGKRKQRHKKNQAEIPPVVSNYYCNYSPEIINDTIETHDFYKSPNDTWNKIEEASLMLGLYIFGKSFDQLKRFIGSKTIGDIQTFYYTKFYKSEDHKRWKVYRKARLECIIKGRKKRRAYRQTLFATPTHQYLLSRLLNNGSGECCKNLLQAFKNFQENKLSLEDYVIALKNLVGIEALIDVVGIGKDNTFEINLPIAIEKVEGDETIVNDVTKIKFDDHEYQLGNGDVESLRKSRRPPIPSTKALEAVVDKYEEETSCKRRRYAETLRKSRRPPKPSTKALEVVVDKYEEEETSCERRQDVDTLRKSRRPPKPSTKELEVVVDKCEEEETSCKRRQDVETERKSKRSPKPSTKALEAIVDKHEEKASCKRRRV